MAVSNLEIADAIDSNPLNKAYDEFCKKVLSNKQILAHIMKTCIPEYHDIPLEDIPAYIEYDPLSDASIENKADKINGMNTEDKSVSGAQINYDLLFHAKLPDSKENENIGLFINIEAQNINGIRYPFLDRAVYYCSRILAGQKNHDGGFMKSDFKNLKKVYSIWIIMDAPEEKEGVFNKYMIKEECSQKEYHALKEEYDKLSIITIYLGKKYDMSDDEQKLMNLLYTLFKADMDAEDKKAHLTKNYGILMTRMIAEEVEGMCNFSQGIMNEGLAKGFAKGRLEGKTEGEMNTTVLNVQNLMESLNMDIDKALDILKISDDLRPIVKEKLS